MEVSQGLIILDMDRNFLKFKTEEELLDFLKKESESCLLCELCGLIGLDEENFYVYKQMQNRSKNPESYFLIDPYDYLSFIKNFKPVGVFHSHLLGDQSPSDFDLKTSENCCLSFFIYSVVTEKFFIYEPQYKDYDVNKIQRLKELI